jgi:hypothetical protein
MYNERLWWFPPTDLMQELVGMFRDDRDFGGAAEYKSGVFPEIQGLR